MGEVGRQDEAVGSCQVSPTWSWKRGVEGVYRVGIQTERGGEKICIDYWIVKTDRKTIFRQGRAQAMAKVARATAKSPSEEKK